MFVETGMISEKVCMEIVYTTRYYVETHSRMMTALVLRLTRMLENRFVRGPIGRVSAPLGEWLLGAGRHPI